MGQFDLKEYEERARKVHGDKYDYVSTRRNARGKIEVGIICHEKDKYGQEHGLFWKQTSKHIQGQGCPKCSGCYRHKTTEEFIAEGKLCHNSPFDHLTYEKTVYKDTNTPVIVTCELHGDFPISPPHFLAGQGCPKCRYLKTQASKRKTWEESIAAIKEKRPEYDYSLVTKENYVDRETPIDVICNEKNENGDVHGVFSTTVQRLLHNQGCPKCGLKKCAESRIKTEDVFFKECSEKHSGFYDYSETHYKKSEDYIYPICPIHGKFRQQARNHLFGQGCPLCAKEKSKLETEIDDFVKDCVGDENVILNDRTILEGKEIDIWIPSKQIGIEVDGLIWHSEKFSNKNDALEKTEKCLEKNIRLIHIFEDEWNYKKEIVKSRIRSILGLTQERIYARKCKIVELDNQTAKDFLNRNHIQGAAICSLRYGLEYNGELVSVMTFGKPRMGMKSSKNPADFELIRFCSKLNTIVIGGASKLFKHFLKEKQPHSVISFCDRRYGSGITYELLGFHLTHASAPSYFYTLGHKRINRLSMRKNILVEKYGCDPSMTEKEFCRQHGFYRIYDCGNFCYQYIS